MFGLLLSAGQAVDDCRHVGLSPLGFCNWYGDCDGAGNCNVTSYKAKCVDGSPFRYYYYNSDDCAGKAKVEAYEESSYNCDGDLPKCASIAVKLKQYSTDDDGACAKGVC